MGAEPAAGRPWRPGPISLGAALLVLGIALFLAFFQWNWLRGPLAGYLSDRLQRPVRIIGNLDVHPWSWTPTASVEGLSIGEPRWVGHGEMARIPRLAVRVRLKTLLFGPLVLPYVELDHPALVLLSDVKGRRNWTFAKRPKGVRTSPPVIQHLVIHDGTVSFTDTKHRAYFSGALNADETGGEPGAGGASVRGRLVLRGAPWAGPTPFLDAPSFLIQTRLMPLMRGRLVLPLVEADGARIRMLRDAGGRDSWSTGAKSGPIHLPAITTLILKNGSIQYDDVARKLRFSGTLASSQQVNGAGKGTFRLVGNGFLNAAPFRALITGGALIDVRKTTPYPFRASIAAGATRIGVAAVIAHPFDFGQLSGALKVTGPNLGDLHSLTGLALPSTPPYQLSAGFARRTNIWALRRIQGRVGESDLAGSLTVDHTAKRPLLTADLSSRYLELADLTTAFGAAPRHTAGRILSPRQKAISARLRAEHRLLPDTPLDLAQLSKMDARVFYRAGRVLAGRTPLRSLAFRLTLNQGVLSFNPVEVTLPQGRMSGLIRIDAHTARPTTLVDLSLANARLENLIDRGKPNPPLEGSLYGRARLAGTGNSVAAVAGSSNGTFALVVPHGEIRQAFAELTGIDAAKGLYLLLSKNQRETPIRCGVADFQAVNGVLHARDFVLDTGVVTDTGKGDINLRDETLSLALTGKPKKFRLLRIAAPITVTGRLDSPKVGVDVAKAAPQLAASALLGVFATPLAAVLPFIHLGGRHNADCAALIAHAQAAPPPRLVPATRRSR